MKEDFKWWVTKHCYAKPKWTDTRWCKHLHLLSSVWMKGCIWANSMATVFSSWCFLIFCVPANHPRIKWCKHVTASWINLILGMILHASGEPVSNQMNNENWCLPTICCSVSSVLQHNCQVFMWMKSIENCNTQAAYLSHVCLCCSCESKQHVNMNSCCEAALLSGKGAVRPL